MYNPQAMLELVRSFKGNAEGFSAIFARSQVYAVGNIGSEGESISKRNRSDFLQAFVPSLESTTRTGTNLVAILVSDPKEWASASMETKGSIVLGVCIEFM